MNLSQQLNFFLPPLICFFFASIMTSPIPITRLRSRTVHSSYQRMFVMLQMSKSAYAFSVRSLSTGLSSILNDPTLLTSDDNDEHTESLPTFSVFDPANPNDSSLAELPSMGQKEAVQAIDRSAAALPAWRDGTTAAARATLLRKWSDLIQQHAADIATIMTLESGKPKAESLGEVNYATSFLDYYASEAIRPTGAGGGFMVPSNFVSSEDGTSPRGQIMAIQQAVGVTALITPWNFPLAMITRKVGPALAAGCTAVVKPSELTPLSAVALKTLADRAGIPRDVVQLVTASPQTTPDVGTEFCTNTQVQKISFTGSTRVGKLLMKLSSDTVKRLSLELGGNAPFIVFDDADLDTAVSAAMASKFRNAGQTCVCADRFLVHSGVKDEFCDRLVQEMKKLRVGPGMKESTKMGPLISAQAAKVVEDKVEEAVADGANLITGGRLMEELGSHFYEPTLLTNVQRKSRIFSEETFGPVVAMTTFDTEEEAVSIANDCAVGLASYFCTKDLSRALRVSRQIEAGLVGVNEGIISTCTAPFGGVKESGLGREGSPMGINEYLETKYIFLNE